MRSNFQAKSLTEIDTFVTTAGPGDRLIYYRGELSLDRDMLESPLSLQERAELWSLADRVWKLFRRGFLVLVQRRWVNGDGFEYVAVRSDKPHPFEEADEVEPIDGEPVEG